MTVKSYAGVNDTVVLLQVDIGRDCNILKSIIDRGSYIPARAEICVDPKQDKACGFRIIKKGVVLVTPEVLGQQLHYIR